MIEKRTALALDYAADCFCYEILEGRCIKFENGLEFLFCRKKVRMKANLCANEVVLMCVTHCCVL